MPAFPCFRPHLVCIIPLGTDPPFLAFCFLTVLKIIALHMADQQPAWRRFSWFNYKLKEPSSRANGLIGPDHFPVSVAWSGYWQISSSSFWIGYFSLSMSVIITYKLMNRHLNDCWLIPGFLTPWTHTCEICGVPIPAIWISVLRYLARAASGFHKVRLLAIGWRAVV